MTQLTVGRKNAIMGRIRGQVALSKPIQVPAPTGGWNAVDSLTSMEPSDSVELWNLIPGEGGVSVRPGYVNECYDINGVSTDVRSVMGFNGATADANRLFVATDQGIYEISSVDSNPALITFTDGVGGAPLAEAGWPIKGGDAGWCSWVNMVNSVSLGGKHYLLVCDEVNGYHIYDSELDEWAKVTSANLEGVDPTDLVHVCQWKARIFLTERDSGRVWFLTPGAVLGTGSSRAVAIDFGSRFPHGGFLKGCYTWTYDGGSGIDDFLVAIASSGDVLVWEGVSPIDTSFILKGMWYVGDPPAGRRITCDQNGDLWILGGLGVIPISQLVAGGAEMDKKYASYKVQNLLRGILRERRSTRGWALTSHPSYGVIVLSLPYNVTEDRYETLCFSTDIVSWAMLTDINSICWESWWGNEYIGTDDGRVVVLSGYMDLKQSYSAPDFTFTADQIEWKTLTSFSGLDAPANLKKVHLIRPLFVTTSYPAYNVQARFDFDISIPASIDSSPITSGPIWDTALWDNVIWGGQYITEHPVYGAAGMGRWVAIALTGKSSVETTLIGFDVIGELGGLL